MRTTKEERADLRARCRAGVIAITTDAALVAALVDDVEELDALVDNAARSMAKLATASTAELDRLHAERNEARAEVDRLRGELAEARDERDAYRNANKAVVRERDAARAERDARPEITPELASIMIYIIDRWLHITPQSDFAAILRAHAGKVAR